MTGGPSAGLTLTAEELDGDLPMVCARTGRPAEALTPVWFARSRWWAWVPLAVVVAVALVRGSLAPLASAWALAALLVPLLASRLVTGRLPLDGRTRRRLATLRTRRFRVTMAALALTWVAVALRLLGVGLGSVIVLAVVIGLYVWAVGMALAGRLLAVRGRPTTDGGATLHDPHPDFVAAVQLRRTGHRP